MGYSWWDYGEWSKKEIDMVKGGKLTNPCDGNGLYLHCARSIPGCIIRLLQMLPLKKIGQRIHGIYIISYKGIWICNYLKTKSYLWKKSLGKPNSIRFSRYNLTCNTEFQLPNILHIEVMFHSYNYGFPPWRLRCMKVAAISTLFAIVLPVLCLNHRRSSINIYSLVINCHFINLLRHLFHCLTPLLKIMVRLI